MYYYNEMQKSKLEQKDTPIIIQYKNIKQQHNDKLLFFHLGDFFEMFYEDAEIVAKTLGLTLTYRKNGDEKIFMCGVPVLNKNFYIKKLLNHGFKIAICEQVETPLESKKRGATIVNRSVTAIYTAGTYVDENNSDNQYILSLNIQENNLYCFYLDLATEDFFYERLVLDDLQNLLYRVNPKEILIQENIKVNFGNFEEIVTTITLNPLLKQEFSDILQEFLSNSSQEEIDALRMLFAYIYETYNTPPKKIPHIGVNSRETTLDKYTIQNLDLFTSKASLYSLLNHNITALGKRKLRDMLVKPLLQPQDINKRLEVVQYFYNQYLLDTPVFNQIISNLHEISDLQKIIFLLKKGKITPYLIDQFLNSLKKAEEIVQLLKMEGQIPELLTNIIFPYTPMEKYKELQNVFEPNDNLFKQNFLNNIYAAYNLEETLSQINQQMEEIKRHIPNVKLNNNSIIGYFFEITAKDRGLMESLPIIYMVKQTLLNNIRFTTKTLIELENNLLFVEAKRLEIRTNVLKKFINQILEDYDQMQQLINIIGTIDLFSNLGIISVKNNYYKPTLTQKEYNQFQFKNGRHAILEQRKKIIQNDLCMNKKRLTFITGPNMGGKSTFMRTTALIVLMAQIGCFVPAEEVVLSPFNNIFVRIGYQDDQLEGESTFFKEMKECAEILRRCNTPNTLILFDEMCRGTSYQEGIILSQEIIKYFFKQKVFVLVSSHYLELAKFLQKNYANEANILYTKYLYEDNILKFLYKITEGVIDRSFSIQVAKIAGLPEEIITGAENYFK